MRGAAEGVAEAKRKKREIFEKHCEETGYKPPTTFAERSWRFGGGPLW
jgi:hypothetical protein